MTQFSNEINDIHERYFMNRADITCNEKELAQMGSTKLPAHLIQKRLAFLRSLTLHAKNVREEGYKRF